MRKLPYCDYPKTADTDAHGFQSLPTVLPILNLDRAESYRSKQYNLVVTDTISRQKVLQLARVIAESFVFKEPMTRHLQPPMNAPSNINSIIHRDPFGEHYFGEWTKENLTCWIIRLFLLTDPRSMLNNIEINQALLTVSMAMMNEDGEIIGGSLNMPFSFKNLDTNYRTNDPFINALFFFFIPIELFLISQETVACSYLGEKYPVFKSAAENGKVGILFMIARSPKLPGEDAFELVAATAERFKELGYQYMVSGAANQWTGAALEILGGVRVHYAPYRTLQRVNQSAEGLAEDSYSTDGYIASKDSGCMFYILRLV